MSHPLPALARSIPACLPEQLCRTGRDRSRPTASRCHHGHAGGHRSAFSSRSARERTLRTASTCTGSPLWEAHITAMPSWSSDPPHASTDTAACNGFSEERANTTRPASPACATSRPSASHTATCPRCTDSSTPDRTTRASTTGSLTGGSLRRRDLREVFLVAALQLVLERVVDTDHGGSRVGDHLLLVDQPPFGPGEVVVGERGGVGDGGVGHELLDPATSQCDLRLRYGHPNHLPPARTS